LTFASVQLQGVFAKLRPFWYPQLDKVGAEIDLCEVNQRNVSLETPLIVAAQHLSPEDIQILVDHGADINARSGSEQHSTALHVARVMRRFDNAKRLIELGADVTIKDNNGMTALEIWRDEA
jgi:ankyrin repeat protein